MLTLLVALAGAHPGAFRLAYHELEVQAGESELRLDYELAVPHHALAHGTALPDADELLGGFRVLVDDAELPLTAEGDLRVADGENQRYAKLVLTAPLPAGAHDLVVENGNFPDLPGSFRTTWRFAPTRSLTGPSPDAPWEQDEALRRSEAQLGWRGLPLRAVQPPRALWVDADAAREPHVLPSWLQGGTSAWHALMALALAPLVAASSPRPASAPAGRALVLALLGGLLATLPAVWGAPVVVLGGLIGLRWPDRPFMSAMALLALAAATGWWPLAALLAGLGCFASRRDAPPRWPLRLGVALLTALWLARAIGTHLG